MKHIKKKISIFQKYILFWMVWITLLVGAQGGIANSNDNVLDNDVIIYKKSSVSKFNLVAAGSDEYNDNENLKSIDENRFYKLFLGSYQPASKVYFGQGEMLVEKDAITWKGCDRVSYKIINQIKDSYYLEIIGSKYCVFHEEKINYLRFSIIQKGLFKGNIELNLYDSKPKLLKNEYFVSGIIGRIN